jgi:hypothetical protein
VHYCSVRVDYVLIVFSISIEFNNTEILLEYYPRFMRSELLACHAFIGDEHENRYRKVEELHVDGSN